MKYNLHIKRRLGHKILLLLAVFCLSALAAYAEGNVQIDTSDASYQIQNHGGASMDPVVGTNLEFFRGSAPAPNVGAGALAPTVTTPRPNVTNFYFAERGALYVRVWEGAMHTMGEGNYYGTTRSGYNKLTRTSENISLPAPPATASQYYLNTVQAVYQAMPPYVPTIDRDRDVTESVVRDHYTANVNMRLTVTVNYSEGSPRRQISASSPAGTNFEVEIEYPDGSTDTRSTNGTLTLSGLTDRGTYRFRARAFNWFGAGEWSDWVEWATLSGGAAGPQTVTYTFRRPAGDLGLNPISFPFSSVTDVTTLRDLIEAINTQVGENVVTTAGWWDAETQNPVGYLITYDSAGVASYITAGGAPADPADVALVRDRSYQISVLREATASFTGTR